MPQPINIVRWKGAAQMASRMNGHETGFAHLKIAQGEHYRDASAKHYYIIAVKYGAIQLTTRLYKDKVIGGYTMALAPKSGVLEFTAREDAEVILFAFTTTIIRTDKEMLDYFCTHAAKRSYRFNTLQIGKAMGDLLDLILTQIHERKLRNSGICHVWNTYFFHVMAAYYTKDEITDFMRPILSGGSDFEAFIENNYLEARGNVTRLIALSGLSVVTFTNKFVALYGMRPKQWLDERLKTAIIDMAQDEGMTPTLIAQELDMPPQRLNDFTHRVWNLTAGEALRQIREGILNSEL